MTADEDRMKMAVTLARNARLCGARPFGTWIVGPNGQYLGSAGGSESPTDPTRHSEMLAIQRACKSRGLLYDCTMYQTHEPCSMCCGAIKHAKLSRVVYGSTRADLPELFRQCTHTAVDLLKDTSRPPVVEVGVLRDECIQLFGRELVAYEDWVGPWKDQLTRLTMAANAEFGGLPDAPSVRLHVLALFRMYGFTVEIVDTGWGERRRGRNWRIVLRGVADKAEVA